MATSGRNQPHCARVIHSIIFFVCCVSARSKLFFSFVTWHRRVASRESSSSSAWFFCTKIAPPDADRHQKAWWGFSPLTKSARSASLWCNAAVSCSWIKSRWAAADKCANAFTKTDLLQRLFFGIWNHPHKKLLTPLFFRAGNFNARCKVLIESEFSTVKVQGKKPD